MSEELKPCPHCGLGGDEIELLEDRERVIVSHYVYCDGCGARTGYKFSGEAAIAAWNRRAPSPSILEGVAELIMLRILALDISPVSAKKEFAIEELQFVLGRIRSLTGAKP